MEQRYEALDGLRAFAAVGIVMMHVFGNGYEMLVGIVFERVIPEMTNFTFLFMVLSGFSLCCGYYERMTRGEISPEAFYTRRLGRIWPFFALMCVLDVLVSPSRAALCEAFVNLTLLHALLPNPNLSVMGTGWFLGVIFVFYLAFPFFCVLLKNRRRAWAAFVAALLLNILCGSYFFDAAHVPQGIDARRSFLFCAVFFMAGGMVYLYRDALREAGKRARLPLLAAVAALLLALGRWPKNAIVWLGLSCLLTILALGAQGRLLSNPLTRLVSNYSLEIYLSHMLVFRVLERLGVIRMLPGAAGYMLTVLLTLAGAVLFSAAVKAGLNAGACWAQKRLHIE